MSDTAEGGIEGALRRFAAEFDPRFAACLEPAGDVPPVLAEAMRYAALAPGKRIRPFLVVRCCELVGGDAAAAWASACAVECIHAFSLIHDDLPAMDDDALRRGLPTCHVKFGEAVAILAGDALSVLAFECLANQRADAARVIDMVRELATAAGRAGMIGGQAADVLGEREAPLKELVRYIHERKTARLFAAACRLGALAGGGSTEQITALGLYGQNLGVAFQIADDLLDVTASRESLGKAVKKDAVARKQTFPQCVGLEASRTAAAEAAAAALTAIAVFGDEAADLRSLAQFVIARER